MKTPDHPDTPAALTDIAVLLWHGLEAKQKEMDPAAAFKLKMAVHPEHLSAAVQTRLAKATWQTYQAVDSILSEVVEEVLAGLTGDAD